jgi:muramoyltetrapeptide carboxypeptidase
MPRPVKPPALVPGSAIRIIAPASPVEEARLGKGCDELARLGYTPRWDPRVLAQKGFFAGSADERLAVLSAALADPQAQAIVCARGGYGSNYLLESLRPKRLRSPKILLGFSDVTALQIYLWQSLHWVSCYGPMAAAGFDAGAGADGGYDAESFARAVTETHRGWSIELRGETLLPGRAAGVVLGGCLTLVVATLGTPWELDTRGAILLLEDRGMKPFQVDRALLHLMQAGKLKNVRGIIFGEFPDCDAPPGSESVRDVAERLMLPLALPIVWGAAVGHTPRPMLTVPLGVCARLVAHEEGRLDILEPAVREPAKQRIRGGRSSKRR